jgi:hypothetical protein
MNPVPPPADSTPAPDAPPGWTPLPVEHLPEPTFWPAAFALGITFVFWGLISSWVVFVVGLIAFAGALAGWIAEIRHERKPPHS